MDTKRSKIPTSFSNKENTGKQPIVGELVAVEEKSPDRYLDTLILAQLRTKSEQLEKELEESKAKLLIETGASEEANRQLVLAEQQFANVSEKLEASTNTHLLMTIKLQEFEYQLTSKQDEITKILEANRNLEMENIILLGRKDEANHNELQLSLLSGQADKDANEIKTLKRKLSLAEAYYTESESKKELTRLEYNETLEIRSKEIINIRKEINDEHAKKFNTLETLYVSIETQNAARSSEIQNLSKDLVKANLKIQTLESQAELDRDVIDTEAMNSIQRGSNQMNDSSAIIKGLELELAEHVSIQRNLEYLIQSRSVESESLESDIQTLQMKNNQITSVNSELSNTIIKLESNISTLNKNASSNDSSRKEIESMTSRLLEASDANTQLQSSNLLLANNLSVLNSESAHSNTLLIDLQEKIKYNESENKLITSQLFTLQSQLEMETAQNKLSTKEYDAMVTKLNRENAQLTWTIASLKKFGAELEQQIERTGLISGDDRLHLISREREIRDLNLYKTGFEEEIRVMEEKMVAYDLENSTLVSSELKLKDECVLLQATINQMEIVKSGMETITFDLANERKERFEVDVQLISLKEQCENELTKRNANASLIISLQEKIDVLIAERTLYIAQIENITNESFTRDLKVRELESQILNANELNAITVAGLESTISSLSSTLTSGQNNDSETALATDALDDMYKKFISKSSEYELLKVEKEELSSRFLALESYSNGFAMQCTQLQSEKAQLATLIREGSDVVSSMIAERAILISQLDGKDLDISKLVVELNVKSAEIERLESNVNAMNVNMQQMTAEFLRNSTLLVNSKESELKLSEELKSMNELLEKKTLEIVEHQKSRVAHTELINRLKAASVLESTELETLEVKHQQLSINLDQLTQELNSTKTQFEANIDRLEVLEATNQELNAQSVISNTYKESSEAQILEYKTDIAKILVDIKWNQAKHEVDRHESKKVIALAMTFEPLYLDTLESLTAMRNEVMETTAMIVELENVKHELSLSQAENTEWIAANLVLEGVLNEKNMALNEISNRLENEAADRISTIESLKMDHLTETEHLNVIYQTLIADTDKLKSELRNEIVVLNASIIKSNQESIVAAREFEFYQTESIAMREKLDAELASKCLLLEETLSEKSLLVSELDVYKCEASTLQKELKGVEAESVTMMDTLNGKNVEIDSLSERIAVFEAASQNSTIANEKLDVIIAEKNALQVKVECSNDVLKQFESALKIAQEEMESKDLEIGTNHENIKILNEQIASIGLVTEALKTREEMEVSRLESENTILSQKKELESKASTILDIMETLAKKETHEKGLKIKMDEAIEQYTRLTGVSNENFNKLEESKMQLLSSLNSIKELELTVDTLKKSNVIVENERNESRASLCKLESEFNTSISDLNKRNLELTECSASAKVLLEQGVLELASKQEIIENLKSTLKKTEVESDEIVLEYKLFKECEVKLQVEKDAMNESNLREARVKFDESNVMNLQNIKRLEDDLLEKTASVKNLIASDEASSIKFSKQHVTVERLQSEREASLLKLELLESELTESRLEIKRLEALQTVLEILKSKQTMKQVSIDSEVQTEVVENTESNSNSEEYNQLEKRANENLLQFESINEKYFQLLQENKKWKLKIDKLEAKVARARENADIGGKENETVSKKRENLEVESVETKHRKLSGDLPSEILSQRMNNNGLSTGKAKAKDEETCNQQ